VFGLAEKIETPVGTTTRVEKKTQAILAKAFRGELVPTEAELDRHEGRDYQPTNALLEGIRAEKTTADSRPGAGRKWTRSPNAK
jgi:type I restriction enzyme S subunit